VLKNPATIAHANRLNICKMQFLRGKFWRWKADRHARFSLSV
jgi:hypothetical protein